MIKATPLKRKCRSCEAGVFYAVPQSLEGAGKALRFTEGKLEEGKDLIRLFAVPRKPTKSNPSRWNKPSDFPEEWRQYCRYNKRDVEVEDKLRQVLPMPPKSVWREMWENERINDRGVLLDMELVQRAIETNHEREC